MFSHAISELNLSLSSEQSASTSSISPTVDRAQQKPASREGPLVLQSTSRSSATMCSLGLSHTTFVEEQDRKDEEATAWVVEKPVNMIDSRRDYISQHLDSEVVTKLDHIQTDYEVSGRSYTIAYDKWVFV